MPNIGAPELIVILVIALLILGPGKLPEVGASIGKSIREFRKASSDIEDSVKVNVETSPLPPTPAAPATPAEAPAPQPAVAAHAADLPGAPTVATTPAATTPTSESTASSN